MMPLISYDYIFIQAVLLCIFTTWLLGVAGEYCPFSLLSIVLLH